jgi:hypothetical protein
MKLASTPVPPIPGVTPGGGGNFFGNIFGTIGTAASAAIGVGATGVALALAGFATMFAAQTAVQQDRFNAYQKGEDSFFDTIIRPWTWPGAVGDLFRGNNGGTDNMFGSPNSFGGVTNDPMSAKYASGGGFLQSFGGLTNNPMNAKYNSPTFNVYVGADTVADAVVPVIARTVTTTPRGGR